MDDPWDIDGNYTETGRSFNDNFKWTTALENAIKGDADFQYQLGVWHLNGGNTFVDIDKEEAVEWLAKAAEQGHEDAKKMLKRIEIFSEE